MTNSANASIHIWPSQCLLIGLPYAQVMVEKTTQSVRFNPKLECLLVMRIKNSSTIGKHIMALQKIMYLKDYV